MKINLEIYLDDSNVYETITLFLNDKSPSHH